MNGFSAADILPRPEKPGYRDSKAGAAGGSWLSCLILVNRHRHHQASHWKPERMFQIL